MRRLPTARMGLIAKLQFHPQVLWPQVFTGTRAGAVTYQLITHVVSASLHPRVLAADVLSLRATWIPGKWDLLYKRDDFRCFKKKETVLYSSIISTSPRPLLWPSVNAVCRARHALPSFLKCFKEATRLPSCLGLCVLLRLSPFSTFCLKPGR